MIKTSHLQYILIAITCNPFEFATSSFLQGAHSNTAFRKHYYKTYNNHRHDYEQYDGVSTRKSSSSLSLQQMTAFQTLKPISSWRLYGTNLQSDDEENEDDDDNENDEHENEVHNSQKQQHQQQKIENFRQSLENLFAIPNDNQSQNSKKQKSSSQDSYSIIDTTSATDESNTNTNKANTIDNNSNDNKNNKKTNNQKDNNQQQITEIPDITKIITNSSPPPPPLTAVGRERRLKEISLLTTLSKSDDAISDLWALWIAEKGPTAATLLLRSEQLMHVESYDEAESILWSIIRQYGIQWAEPINRLATLKYMQGSYEESKQLCEIVLSIKPWHFGVLRGIVLICTASNDASGARLWSEKCCPNFIGERRSQWVRQAIEAATQRLRDAAQVGRTSIAQEEMEFRLFRTKLQRLNMEDDVGNMNRNNNDDYDDLLFSSEDLNTWQ